MNIISLLKERKLVFAVDDIEPKKSQTLVNAANKCFLDMADAIDSFKEYKQEQLNGELHTKIVMVKSLAEQYPDWQAVGDVLRAAQNQQHLKTMEFNTYKIKLVNSFKALLQETKTSPVVSLYDLFGQDYQLCTPGHEVIILGEHNNEIIQYAIDVFDEMLVAKGNFETISGITLQANYSTVEQNAELCNSRLHSGSSKANKVAKIEQAIQQMVDIGKKVVMFVTYKNSLAEIGVKEKDLAALDKQYAKQYIPIKKLLQKELGVKLADICNISVDEDSFTMYSLK